MKIHQFTLYHFLNEYNQNREIIDAYLNGNTMEGFTESFEFEDGDSQRDDVNTTVSSLPIGTFIAIFAFLLAIWIWALVVTIQFWHFIPVWTRVTALIGLFTGVGGPVLTLIVVYASKSKKKIKD